MNQTNKTAVILLVMLTLVVFATAAQEPAPQVEKFQMADNLYRLQCQGTGGFTVNLMVLEGAEGLLVVDAGYMATQQEVADMVAGIGNGKVTTMVYTHVHADHLGAGKLLGAEANIIAHENTTRRLDLQFGFQGEEAIIRVPTVALVDSAVLDFGGQQVRLLHFPKAHTDGDIVAHFVDDNVVFLGDLVFPGRMPFVHDSRGGTISGLRKAYVSLLDMFGDDVTFVPAHGEPMTKVQFADYDGQLAKMVGIVEPLIESGQSPDEMIAADVLSEWRAWNSPNYNTDTVLITSIYVDKIYAGNPPQPVGEVMLTMVVEDGIEAAIEFYHKVKTEQPDKYDFSEMELNALGYNLMWRNMLDEAEAAFKLNIEVFPQSGNVYDSMGELYLIKGDTAQSITYYEKSVQLAPDNVNAVELLKNLKAAE